MLSISYPIKDLKYFDRVLLKGDYESVNQYCLEKNYILDSYEVGFYINTNENIEPQQSNGSILYAYYNGNQWVTEYSKSKIVKSLTYTQVYNVDANNVIVINDSQTNITFSYIGATGTTATIFLSGESFIVSNSGGNFIWDLGGTGEYNFGTGNTGSIQISVNGTLFTIAFTRGSLYFNIKNDGIDPQKLILTPIPTGVRLSWNYSSSYDGYEVWISVNSGNYYLLGITLTETYDDIVSHNESISYKIIGYSGIIYSDYSNEVSITLTDIKYLSKTGGTEYAYVADNGALDFGTGAFTMCAWIKGSGVGGVDQFWLGKHVFGSLNGRYGIYTGANNKYTCIVQGYIQSSSKVSNVLCTDGQWHFHCLTFTSDATPLMIYKIDGNVIAGGNSHGSGATLSNAFEFYIGAGNNGAGNGVSIISKGLFNNVIVYKSRLTDEEQTSVMNGFPKAGYAAYWKCAEYPLIDETGTYNLTGVNLTSANILTTPNIP